MHPGTHLTLCSASYDRSRHIDARIADSLAFNYIQTNAASCLQKDSNACKFLRRFIRFVLPIFYYFYIIVSKVLDIKGIMN